MEPLTGVCDKIKQNMEKIETINQKITNLQEIKLKIANHKDMILKIASIQMYYDEIKKQSKQVNFGKRKRKSITTELKTLKNKISKYRILLNTMVEEDYASINVLIMNNPKTFESASQMWDSVHKNFLQCLICCYKLNVNNFTFLNCGHFFCKTCLSKVNTDLCMLCRTKIISSVNLVKRGELFSIICNCKK